MNMQFHGDAIAIVRLVQDSTNTLKLGTAFSFLKSNWYLTAKHVVVDDETDQPRFPLSINTTQGNVSNAKIKFIHPRYDLAILETEKSICPQPLMPAHHDFVGKSGLFKLGFDPTLGGIDATWIKAYEIEERERDFGVETVLSFQHEGATGGNSGGPILGDKGGVVGVMIEKVSGSADCRATSINAILSQLSIQE